MHQLCSCLGFWLESEIKDQGFICLSFLPQLSVQPDICSCICHMATGIMITLSYLQIQP